MEWDPHEALDHFSTMKFAKARRDVKQTLGTPHWLGCSHQSG
jgi:hypothetical protein